MLRRPCPLDAEGLTLVCQRRNGKDPFPAVHRLDVSFSNKKSVVEGELSILEPPNKNESRMGLSQGIQRNDEGKLTSNRTTRPLVIRSSKDLLMRNVALSVVLVSPSSPPLSSLSLSCLSTCIQNSAESSQS